MAAIPVSGSELLDETYTRLRATGPEFQGWLSNHGPMAADAMIRLGHGAEVERWVDQYIRRMEEAPSSRCRIEEDEWRAALGDPARLGDWIDLFDRELREQPATSPTQVPAALVDPVLPALPQRLWIRTFEAAWAASAAISTVYHPSGPPPPVDRDERRTATPDQVSDRAVGTGDEHAIKFTEVAQESHRRGNPNALAAGARASHLIAALELSQNSN